VTAERPTLERIFLGLIAGAGAGGLLVSIVGVVAGGSILSSAVYGLVAALALLATLPLIHTPIWLALWIVRLRGALGACLAGAGSFLVTLAMFEYLFSGRTFGLTAFSLIVIGIGPVMGFVIWRVSLWGPATD
jgi:hypothetical protein